MKKIYSFKTIHILFITLMVFMFSNQLQSQNTYVVNSNSVSIKSGPGKDYATVGKLKKGDTVQVYNYTSVVWARIKFENKDGFVNKYSLTEATRDDVIPEKKKESSPINIIISILTSIWFWLAVAFIVGWILLGRAYKKKCSNCGKWNVMAFIKIEDTPESANTGSHSRNTMKKEDQEYARHKKPATKNYQVHRKCRSCGFEDYEEKILKTAK